jgi:hypothetical protein
MITLKDHYYLRMHLTVNNTGRIFFFALLSLYHGQLQESHRLLPFYSDREAGCCLRIL